MLKYNFLSAPLALVITKTKMKQTVLTNPQTYSSLQKKPKRQKPQKKSMLFTHYPQHLNFVLKQELKATRLQKTDNTLCNVLNLRSLIKLRCLLSLRQC